MSAVEPIPDGPGPDETGSPENGHHADVAATAARIRRIVGVLRELDFGETPPASRTPGRDESSGRGETDASL